MVYTYMNVYIDTSDRWCMSDSSLCHVICACLCSWSVECYQLACLSSWSVEWYQCIPHLRVPIASELARL